MTCYDNAEPWIRLVWIASGLIAFFCAILLMGVMQEAEKDRSCRSDSIGIKNMRRWGFIQSTLILLGVILAIWFELPPPLMILGLVSGACYHVGINYLALHYRQRPPDAKLHKIQGAGVVSTRDRRPY
jgi:uncharacterized membrane protein